jgi:hypothetical protein
MSDDLINFLRARLDDDAAMARSAGAEPWSAMTEETPDGENIYYTVETRKPPRALVESLATGPSAQARIDHMGRHHPARVLREVEAKRELLSRYEAMEAGVLVVTGLESIVSEYRRVILPQLALPYADRPGYREEWRP